MKGVALPITAIIIVALSALVLVVITGFFGTGVGKTQLEIQREQAFQNACQKLRTIYNCAESGLDKSGVFYSEPGDDPEISNYYCLGDSCTEKPENVVTTNGGKGLGLCAIKGLTPNQCLIQCGCRSVTGISCPEGQSFDTTRGVCV
jgi:Tfp pilus assembly protein PilX